MRWLPYFLTKEKLWRYPIWRLPLMPVYTGLDLASLCQHPVPEATERAFRFPRTLLWRSDV
ncbi:hypothetical protein U9M48_018107 [Paspalum notatum var. saurae]|uniref:Uncharacterized protein n=1 Tax=Paspalum notatum var. saurae TaxID=547442 RepID=A0AAQ3T8U7_PASNO